MIATRFHGPPDGFNIVPQDADLNHKEWLSMEDEWATALKAGHEVEVGIQSTYLDDSRRPAGFDVIYRVIDKEAGEDKYYTKTFYNESSKGVVA
jgi:filamentous hemagglutinin